MKLNLLSKQLGCLIRSNKFEENPSDQNLSASSLQLIILTMKISEWDEKGNAHHFGSYDTYFPFQQESPNKNVFYNVFLRQLDFFGKSSKLHLCLSITI